MRAIDFSNLTGDLYGGLTAAVVALPLALAFGVSSGAGPVAGVYGAVFVGFFAAFFGGTPSQVSGPTGPMTVVFTTLITSYAHEPAMAFTVVIMAGLIQIGLGLGKVGRFVTLMPYPVISGFMTGIGCIIIILQFAPFVGVSNPAGSPLDALIALPRTLAEANPRALLAGVLTLAVVIFTPPRFARLLPASLAGLLAGSIGTAMFLGEVPLLGQIPTGLPNPQLPAFEIAALPGMIKSALVLAVLGSIDSLLTSLIADNITQTRHDPDRELIGQGIGNTVAGIMGGIPGAGATMRTVVNVRAGGRTPVSGMIHALILLAVILGLGGFAAHIPHAVLAGILIKVGYDIIDWDYLRRATRAPKAGVTLMAVTFVLTVAVDLITAVAVGVVMASLLFVKRMADLQVESIRTILEHTGEVSFSDAERAAFDAIPGTVMYVHLEGPMSFGAANEMGRKLTQPGGYTAMVLDLTDVPFIDSSAAVALNSVISHITASDKRTFLVGVKPRVKKVLDDLGVLDGSSHVNVVPTRLDAFLAVSAGHDRPDGDNR